MRRSSGIAWVRPYQWWIASGAALYAMIYAGVLRPRGIAIWFAERPEVAQAFSDPNFGRADALILVFSTLFLGPLALLIGLVLLVFLIAMFGGFLLPITRWFRLPEWMATVLVLSGLVGAAWMESEIWLPRSIWFLGLLARACRIVLSV